MDLTQLMQLSDLIDNRDKIKKVFFYRICGTGMGNVAVLMKEMGYEVAGADLDFYPPMDSYLEEMGIKCYPLSGFDKNILTQFDLIVVGNAVGRNSEHARLIESTGVPFTSFPCALGGLVLQDRKVIGVAGTHGKTTTSYLMVQILEKLGMNPGYLIGGVIGDRASAKIGKGDYFIIESDEYDSAYFHKMSKFHFYNISHLILTSLEFDHGDIFSSLEDIENEFRDLFPQVRETLLLSEDYPSLRKIYKEQSAKHKNKKWALYGETSKNGPLAISIDEKGSEFQLKISDQVYKFSTNLGGKHNILNLSSCLFMASLMGIEISRLMKVTQDLKMVLRRQEEKGHYRGALVIDDFAHHPTAVSTTLDGLKKKYPNKKIVTIFAPTSATSRSNYFQREFTDSLMISDQVIFVKATAPTTLKGCKDFDGEMLVKDLTDKGIVSNICRELSALIQVINETVEKEGGEDILLVFLSNGSILGLWNSKFADEIT